MEAIATLIVCEKPDAAARVASALDDDGDPRRGENAWVPFFECRHGRETIFVCSAVGHLFSIDSKSKTSRSYYPVWDYSWKPKNLINKHNSRIGQWITTIRSLANKADRFANACDYDVEGSLIGLTILRYACNGADSKAFRMKFSTMTENELKMAYRAVEPRLDFSQAEAGQCRHELDWLYGINLSRVLTESNLKQGQGYSTLSTGRVQGPTLKFVVEREEEIQCFVPTPYWTISATIEHDGTIYVLQYEKARIASSVEADQIVNACKRHPLRVSSLDSETVEELPPTPFDLSTLQAEAFRNFGYTPSRTLGIAERLYLNALISYPRTSSQRLPRDIGYREILRHLANRTQYRLLASKLVDRSELHPHQGQRNDLAHPAIYPTGEGAKHIPLGPESRVYDLIVKRFMATFAEPSLRENKTITFSTGSHKFFLKGSRIQREGCIEFYLPYALRKSQNIPDLRLGETLPFKAIKSDERFTDPPARYNPGSLLREMEAKNIGTKATRSEIIEILYRRGYVKGNRMSATPLAMKIVRILDKYCSLITDPKFTALLENQMEEIQSDQTSRRILLAQTLDDLRPVMLSLIANETVLGADLAQTVAAQRISDKTFSRPCPSCGSNLLIIRSRKSGKRFIGCTGYEKGCRFTLPLPQFGTITITSNKCKKCGFDLVTTRSKRRRPLVSCPNCYAAKMGKSTNNNRTETDITPRFQSPT